MSLSPSSAEAIAELRARQGSGARYDAEGAPHDDLLMARRGTAFFSRQLQLLQEDELDQLLPKTGIIRRQIVAEVSYQARYFARALEDIANAHTVMVTDEYTTDVKRAITLPTRALRALFHHSEVHLNVVWRDLSNEVWSQTVSGFGGEKMGLTSLVKARSDVVWGAAQSIALRFNPSDIPDGLSQNWDRHIPG